MGKLDRHVTIYVTRNFKENLVDRNVHIGNTCRKALQEEIALCKKGKPTPLPSSDAKLEWDTDIKVRMTIEMKSNLLKYKINIGDICRVALQKEISMLVENSLKYSSKRSKHTTTFNPIPKVLEYE